MKKSKRTFGKILMTLMIIFFYLPILYMIIFSFNSGKSLTAFTGFSLRWYQHMMESGDMMEALYTTFSVAPPCYGCLDGGRNDYCNWTEQIQKGGSRSGCSGK